MPSGIDQVLRASMHVYVDNMQALAMNLAKGRHQILGTDDLQICSAKLKLLIDARLYDWHAAFDVVPCCNLDYLIRNSSMPSFIARAKQEPAYQTSDSDVPTLVRMFAATVLRTLQRIGCIYTRARAWPITSQAGNRGIQVHTCCIACRTICKPMTDTKEAVCNSYACCKCQKCHACTELAAS